MLMQRIQKNNSGSLRCCFVLFLNFNDFLCRSGDDLQAVIAHAIQQRIKLPPLCVLLCILVREEELIHGYGIAGHKLIKDLQARLLTFIFNICKIARRNVHCIANILAGFLPLHSRRFYCLPKGIEVV